MVDRDAPKSLFTWFIFELARCHEWCPIRSMLGPILFLIYINDPDDTIKSLTLKFANDTKVFSNISYISDHGISSIGLRMANVVQYRQVQSYALWKIKSSY